MSDRDGVGQLKPVERDAFDARAGVNRDVRDPGRARVSAGTGSSTSLGCAFVFEAFTSTDSSPSVRLPCLIKTFMGET